MAEESETQELEKAREAAPKASGGGGGKNPLLTVLLLLNTIIMGFCAFQIMEIHKKTSTEAKVADIAKAVEQYNNEEFEKTSETGEALRRMEFFFHLILLPLTSLRGMAKTICQNECCSQILKEIKRRRV